MAGSSVEPHSPFPRLRFSRAPCSLLYCTLTWDSQLRAPHPIPPQCGVADWDVGQAGENWSATISHSRR